MPEMTERSFMTALERSEETPPGLGNNERRRVCGARDPSTRQGPIMDGMRRASCGVGQ